MPSIKGFPLLFIMLVFSTTLFSANVAPSGTATQSTSIYAKNAIDTDNTTTSLTYAYNHYQWWHLDLGASYAIDSINLRVLLGIRWYIRGARVMVSDTPFTLDASAAGLSAAQSHAAWSELIPLDFDTTEKNFPSVNTRGRYILIQKSDTTIFRYLAMAEVEVFGHKIIPPSANAGPDQVIALGNNLVLDGSASTGENISYAWDEDGIVKGNTASLSLSGLSSGTHTFRLTVTDEYGDTSTDTVTIRVNTAPVANAGPDQNIELGSSIRFDGSGSTDDSGIASYVWSEDSLPIHLSGVSPTLVISNAGTYTVTLTVTDSEGESSTDTVVIRVNTPPKVEDINLSTLINTPITFALTATDADGDTIVSFPVFTSPSNGTLSGPEDNMTYTPNQGFTGTDTFTYKAYDGTSYSELATVTIEVYPPAMAVHDDYNTTYMTRLDGDLFANDLGYNIRITHFNTNAILHGSIDIHNDGTFSYWPNTHFYGSESFSYTITDEFNNTSTTDVNITVHLPKVDLSIVKTAPAEADANAIIEYTLAISSQSGGEYSNAGNVRVRDNLPPNVLFKGVEAADWDCNESYGVVTCNKDNLPAGYSGIIIIRAQVPNSLTESTNTASITSDSRDINPANNSSSATTDIKVKEFDLSITKRVSQGIVNISTSFTYTLNVSNEGVGDATQAHVIDNLDPRLEYTQVTGGNDWVCAGGQTIDCTYNGILASGATAAPIMITVISPSTPANIPNTATVSAGAENNTGNNSASVNVNVVSDIDIENDENLTQIVNRNLNGDFSLIANTNINSNENADYNDEVDMRYVDNDNNTSTFNSSSSTLQIDDNYTVVWAGLFWQGHFCSDDENGSTDGQGTGCDWSNSSYDSYNEATADNNLGKILFRTPGGSYQTINASSINTISRGFLDIAYSSYANVTDIVASAKSGIYWVANIVLTEGQTGGGNYGGWALVTVYEDPNRTLQYKNVSVFKGFQNITTDNVPLAISGFNTPKSGDINASLAFFASDGDPVTGGIISMQQGSGTSFSPISNAANPTDNTLNSTITSFGTAINPGITRTYGVDADRLDVSSFMTNSQTSTNFLFSALVNNTDHFSVDMFTFATDLTTPKVDNLHKRANIISRDGSSVPANSTTLIYPGSLLEYMISFTNSGDEIAEAVEIFDDFDDDGLSNALDLDHFDRDEIKLYHAEDTSGGEVSNPDCKYDAFDHRVSCNVASLAIRDTYTMRFIVKVTNHFGDSILDKNATNTAYAKYRNPNTNAYVNLYTTPQGEEVGGKSDAINSGVFTRYVSNYEHIWVDAINSRFSYIAPNQDRNITTKIANKKFDIQLVHLNKDKQMTSYDAYSNDNNQSWVPMNVLITLEANGKITQPINDPSSTRFYADDNNITVSNLLIPRAYRAESLKMAYIDWKRLISSDSTCSRFDDTQIAMQGLLPCFYSYDFVQEVMPLEDYSDLSVCYSDSDRNGIVDNGSAGYPCDANAYDYDGTPNRQIAPSVYNHKFGCFQCITQSSNQNIFVNISSDDFAVKPDYFEINSSNPSFPDLLRAGMDYNISIVARDGLGNPTKEYNTTDRLIPSEVRFYRSLTSGPNDTFDANTLDDENFTIAFPSRFGISDGETNSTSMPGINYPNVAIRNIGLTDPYWASQTDSDDTPEECNATKNANNIAIETGRNICTKDDAKVRFIPHHFNVTAKLHNHRDDSNVTYLSNDLNMSAHIETTITAMNAEDNITTNFKEDFYEHPMTVDFNVTDWNSSLATLPSHSDDNTSVGTRLDVGLHKHAISTARLLGFGGANNSNGTRTITVQDSNASHRLMFNYARTRGTEKNPFIINGSEVNLTVDSIYTSTRPNITPADINGTSLATQEARFYYGSIFPDSEFYKSVKENNKTTPVNITLYCDKTVLGFTGCRERGIDTEGTASLHNDGKHWLSVNHSMAKNDGNVTLSVATPLKGSLNTPTLDTSDGIDDNIIVINEVNVSSGNPNIVDINSNNTATSSWLIHNADPLYQVEFISDGEDTGASSMWTGHGKTGNVVDDISNRGHNNRLGW